MIRNKISPPVGREIRPLLGMQICLLLAIGTASAGGLSRTYSGIEDFSLEALLFDPIVETAVGGTYIKFYDSFERTDLTMGCEHRRGPLSAGLRGENLLGSDETIVNLSGVNIGPGGGDPWYRVDYKPTWYLKVGWNE